MLGECNSYFDFQASFYNQIVLLGNPRDLEIPECLTVFLLFGLFFGFLGFCDVRFMRDLSQDIDERITVLKSESKQERTELDC